MRIKIKFPQNHPAKLQHIYVIVGKVEEETVENVKYKIQDQYPMISVENMKLFCEREGGRSELINHSPLLVCPRLDEFHLRVCLKAGNSVYVRVPDQDEPIEIKITEDMLISDVKAEIAKRINRKANLLNLVFRDELLNENDQILKDERKVSTCNLFPSVILDCAVKDDIRHQASERPGTSSLTYGTMQPQPVDADPSPNESCCRRFLRLCGLA